jgi:hypothetical protein
MKHFGRLFNDEFVLLSIAKNLAGIAYIEEALAGVKQPVA